ncbi:hypothetical protein EVC45_23015 [Paraburkholderia sp. UYCP14C]|nr:hypothetical protein EVC45_23015 [Paraburkholderia sp. UYCP14C]
MFSGTGRDEGSTSCRPPWHGTPVAGILAASTNNGIGVAGTAWGAKIVPVKVMDACGTGWLSDVATGITWASGGLVSGALTNPYPAQVINISIEGKGTCSRAFQDAIDDAVTRGTTIIVAAGNYNSDVSTTQPANCRDVITVGGVSMKGNRHSLSNYGDLVSIAAPSQNVMSTWNSGINLPAEETYITMDGTSMATPFVTGVAALMQSVASTPLTPSEIKSILVRTARPFALAPDQPVGSGVLDAAAAVQMTRSTHPTLIADFRASTSVDTEETVTLTDTSKITGGKLTARTINWGVSPASRSWLPLTEKRTLYAPGESIGQTINVTLTVTDDKGMSDSVTKPVQIPYPKFEELVRGEMVSNIGRPADSPPNTARYRLKVPAGASNLTFKISGGTGDVNLYARKDLPTFANAACSNALSGSNKTCTIADPQPGDWYVILLARSTFSGVSLAGNYDSP